MIQVRHAPTGPHLHEPDPPLKRLRVERLNLDVRHQPPHLPDELAEVVDLPRAALLLRVPGNASL